jgi:quercetin dioxygenase-like cupin family protein
MWQRLIKEKNLNGGILTIERDQLVQLHDHPGATGILRIISGETEVWQFDELTQKQNTDGTAELALVSHEILKPGDMAVLNPESGNIHALRALSNECSMLDFFIPPYQRSQRSWYRPLDEDWFNRDKISCRKIPQDDYMDA